MASTRRKTWWTLVFILLLAIGGGLWSVPKGPDLNLKPIGINYQAEIKVHQGLDLQGGTHLVYKADVSKVPDKEKDSAIAGAINVIERRINPGGVSEIVIQPAKSLANEYQIIVELPGVSDPNEAISLIGATAKMDFREQDASGNFVETGLTGADFKKASVEINPNTGQPEINIEFNDKGADLFEKITKRNLQKPVAIYLDNQLLSAPIVQSEITSGRGTISGSFTLEEAKRLAIQLNAGALPIPLSLVEQRNVGATLGKDSIEKSFIAGLIGLLVVACFMIFYYRWPGFLATLALAVYSLVTFAIFKNPFQPITMTLAGVAGFILSIGMAVDANILIFERMREELRAGRTLENAVEQGFKRAWTSIRDSNVSSLITCLILFWFGTGSVRGFAVTLSIGILVSMFSAITVTRTFLRATERLPFAKNLWWSGLSRREIRKLGVTGGRK
jgi:preprotein translocase subunit SecD